MTKWPSVIALSRDVSDPSGGVVELGVIGAGPAAASLLERIVANVELLVDRELIVHLIDPHQAGTGRVWRPDNHPGLWMNSLAEDVTMFTDESVLCEGPIRSGPSLFEWAQTVDDESLSEVAPPELVHEIRGLTGTTFPTRRVQSAYLDWFHRRLLATLPANVHVVIHRTTAVDLVDDGAGRQTISLDNGDELSVDVAVLTMGHLDAEPTPAGAALQTFAAAHGLTYVGPGHTAELDLSVIPAGADVISIGFGQAFTDLLVLLTEHRGGRFVEHGDGSVEYVASGREPIIHVGSRRGVPYRSKMDYHLQAPLAPLPRFLDDAAVQRLLARDGELDFRRDVLPLVVQEVGWAYYHELFNAHSERTTVDWSTFSVQYADAPDAASRDALIRSTVRDPADVFDIDALNAPLAGLHFESAEALHRHVRDHVRADVARRTDPEFSADLAAFHALLRSFATVAAISGSRRLSTRSRIEDVGQWWFSFFMYYASGPPPARLRQLLALEAAGLVRFIGAATKVRADEATGRFIATSTSHPDEIVADALVEAVIASATVSRTADRLLQHLRDRGELLEEVVSDATGWSANTGKVVVIGPALNVARADGEPDPARHALGSFTSRPAAGAFSRPKTNAPSFRQNDTVARTILTTLVGARPAIPSR